MRLKNEKRVIPTLYHIYMFKSIYLFPILESLFIFLLMLDIEAESSIHYFLFLDSYFYYRTCFSIYFSISTVGSLYGAASSIMVILLWFYYSAQMFLFGAEFTQVYATQHGSDIRPSGDAIAVEMVIGENEGVPDGDDVTKVGEEGEMGSVKRET